MTSSHEQPDTEMKQEKKENPVPKPLSWWRRVYRWFLDRRFTIEIFSALLVLLLIFLWPRIVISVHSGELGVLYLRFFGGTVTDKVYGEGIHFIFPWDIMEIYDVRIQQLDSNFSVLTVDGLNVDVDVSVRFRPVPETLGLLHKTLGPDYINKVIVQEMQSVLRVIIGQLHPEEIFTTQRDILRTALRETTLQLAEKYIQMDDLLIKKIQLPHQVSDAIERKLRQQQAALEYEYRLLEEEQESKRKKIEAQGIRDFQDIVSEGISDSLLRWKGIEATLELAKSNNAKVVVIGGQGGLPLILNTADMVQPTTAELNAAKFNLPSATSLIPSTKPSNQENFFQKLFGIQGK